MFFCCNKRKCPICLEYKKTYLVCKNCKNTNICFECVTNMCEFGICDKCPVCRQINWKKKIKVEIANDIFKIKYIYKCLDTIISIIKYIYKLLILLVNIFVIFIIIYLIGIITIVIFWPSIDFNKSINRFGLPIFLGLLWLLIIWSPCCCGQTLCQFYFSKN